MAAAPRRSAPGPVKLCVGECRPELSVQSSQLYSFLVRNFYPFRQNIKCMCAINQAEPVWGHKIEHK